MPDELNEQAGGAPSAPAPLGAPTPVPDPAPAPAKASPSGGGPLRPAPWLRAFLLSLAVLAAGAALGAGGFAFEQAHVTWRPQATPAGSGWRLTTSHGQRLGQAALAGSHLVWDAGQFTLLTDLTSGRSKLLGAAAFGGTASTPAASGLYAVWGEVQPAADFARVVWAYDMQSGRRARLGGMEDMTGGPAVAGATAVWTARLPGAQGVAVRAQDIATGKAREVARGEVAESLTAGDSLAAWVSRRTTVTEPPVITVADLGGDARRQVAPYADVRTGRLIGFAVAGRTLFWARDSGGAADQILAFDVDSGTTRLVAAATSIQALAASGDLVVWAEAAQGGGGRIAGVRLGGGAGSPYVSAQQTAGTPFVIARGDGGTITNVYAGADAVAWRVRGALFFDSYLQTAAVPR